MDSHSIMQLVPEILRHLAGTGRRDLRYPVYGRGLRTGRGIGDAGNPYAFPRRLIAPTTSSGSANLSSIPSTPAPRALARFGKSRLALRISTAEPGQTSRSPATRS